MVGDATEDLCCGVSIKAFGLISFEKLGYQDSSFKNAEGALPRDIVDGKSPFSPLTALLFPICQ